MTLAVTLFSFSICALLGFTFAMGTNGNKMSGVGHQPEGEEMRPFLYLKAFYVNPADPRGWLPKMKPSWGWTVNFRSKNNAHIFIVLLLTTVVFAIMLAANCMRELP